MLSAVIIGLTTCGLICIFTLLFIALVDNGLKSTGIGGFILSLIPPSVIFMAGLLVEWKLNTADAIEHHHAKLSDSLRYNREKTPRRRSRVKDDRTVSHLLSTVSDQAGDSEEIVKESVCTADENTPLLH